MKKERCKRLVWSGFHQVQCHKGASKDGLCGTHHPENEKKRRDTAESKYQERIKYRRIADAKMVAGPAYAEARKLAGLMLISELEAKP